MKTAIKRQLKEFVELIDFPIIIYTYETGKLIASNLNARRILGEGVTNINLIWEKKGKLKFPTELLENGTKIYNKKAVIQKENRYEIDIEFCSIPMDDRHMIIGIFEQSYKQIFLKNRIIQLPRIIWRDRELKVVGGNKIFCHDAKIVNHNFSYWNQLVSETEEWETIYEDEKKILKEKTMQENIIQSLLWGENGRRFAKINRFPLTNRNGTAIGVLIIYQAILEKEEYERLFNGVLRENNILNEAIGQSKTIVLSREESKHMPVEYISSNINIWGYQTKEFYSGQITWNDIIYEEDKANFYKNIKKCNYEDKFITQNYRVIKKNGDIAWIQEELLGTSINDNKSYRQSVIKEINLEKA